MKKESTQKKFVALFATVCAMVLLLVGIPFAAAPASAAETPEIQPMTEPCNCGVGVTYERFDTMVIATYTGHTANCTMYAESKYIFLGSNINPFYGHKTVSSPYAEVCVPVINGRNISPYPWMRPSPDANFDHYQTHHILGAQSSSSDKIVTDNCVSGTIQAGIAKTFTLPSDWKSIDGNCAYNGYVGIFAVTKSQRRDTVEIYTDDDDRADIIFTVSVSGNVLSIVSNKTFTCNSRVGLGSGQGAIALHTETA